MKAVREIVTAAIRMDWSQFEGPAALRCTVGVAIPLVAGLVFRQPSISAFGAVGAMSVGFGSFQGAYRTRAAIMVFAARLTPRLLYGHDCKQKVTARRR